ncbi:hypothetical protein M885DRAFT_605275 [Pelagophyceae sp. CCMP2097]|nr:hypothetical protein M885DRAFT_605275 [Pelagophyceae sp. CCMP2097]
MDFVMVPSTTAREALKPVHEVAHMFEPFGELDDSLWLDDNDQGNDIGQVVEEDHPGQIAAETPPQPEATEAAEAAGPAALLLWSNRRKTVILVCAALIGLRASALLLLGGALVYVGASSLRGRVGKLEKDFAKLEERYAAVDAAVSPEQAAPANARAAPRTGYWPLEGPCAPFCGPVPRAESAEDPAAAMARATEPGIASAFSVYDARHVHAGLMSSGAWLFKPSYGPSYGVLRVDEPAAPWQRPFPPGQRRQRAQAAQQLESQQTKVEVSRHRIERLQAQQRLAETQEEKHEQLQLQLQRSEQQQWKTLTEQTKANRPGRLEPLELVLLQQQLRQHLWQQQLKERTQLRFENFQEQLQEQFEEVETLVEAAPQEPPPHPIYEAVPFTAASNGAPSAGGATPAPLASPRQLDRHRLRALTIPQLRSVLSHRGVLCKTCKEKDDLVNEVLHLQRE